jgi:hypothetical protein
MGRQKFDRLFKSEWSVTDCSFDLENLENRK